MVDLPEFTPLNYPVGWPRRSRVRRPGRIPLIGGLVDGLFSMFAGDSELRQFEVAIARQLEARPAWNADWPVDSRQKAIVRALSRAVADEKLDRASVALHPDDPVVLLTWGAFDDLTPLLFETHLARLFRLNKRQAALIDFLRPPIEIEVSVRPDDELLRSQRTVRELVEFYALRLPELANGPDDLEWGQFPWWDRIPSTVGFAILGLILGAITLVIARL